MQITLQIPDDLAIHAIPSGADPARAALEAMAIEGYRGNRLTEFQVRRMLGYSTRMEVHQFLALRDVPLQYTEAHLMQDIAASDQIHCRPSRLGSPQG